MPKRIVDGEGIWKSDKIAAVEPARYRAEYANLLPLALANGSFECNARAIWATCYGYNRPDITPEDVTAILAEFERAKLLFRWTISGKTWGFWVGIDKPGRLPSEARLNGRHDRRGEEVPKDKLGEFLGESLENKTESIGMPSDSQPETSGQQIVSLGLGFGSGLGKGLGEGNGLGSGSGERSGEEKKSNSKTKTPLEKQNQNLSARKQKEVQDQKLLHAEINLYRETHGKEPDYRAFGVICQRVHLDFNYAQRLLSEPAM